MSNLESCVRSSLYLPLSAAATPLAESILSLLAPSLRMKIKSPKRFRKKEKGDTSTAEPNTSARRSKVISIKKLGKKALKGFRRIKRKDKSAQQPEPSSAPHIALEHSDTPPIVEQNRAQQETSKSTSIRQPELEDISKVASILKKTDDIVDTKAEAKLSTRATTPPRPSYRTMVGPNGPPTRSELNSRQASFKRMSGGGRQPSFRRRSSRRNIMRDAPPVDDPKVLENYERIPDLEITKLPRGGLSVETEAVGRVQVSGLTVQAWGFCSRNTGSWVYCLFLFLFSWNSHYLFLQKVWNSTRDN